MTTQTNDKITAAMATLEEGIKNIATSGAWVEYLRAQALFHQYSFANTMLILQQRPDATKVAGFHTWKKLGRHVKKGEKALMILAPMVVAKKAQAEDESDADEQKPQRVFGFKTVPVFDVSQTEGDPLPTAVRVLDGNASGDLFTRLAAFSEANGCPVRVRPIEGTMRGFYEPLRRRITVREGMPLDQMAKTAAHEIAHSILHHDPEVYAAHRGDCELEAESVAFVVLNHFGVDSGGYSFAYVTGWQGGDANAIKALKASAVRIQQTAKAIIEGIEKIPSGDSLSLSA